MSEVQGKDRLGDKPDPRKVTVVGGGSWGTALAHHLRKAGHRVTLWAREVENLKAIAEEGRNPEFFPEISLAEGILVQVDIKKSVENADLVVIAVPSSAVREVAMQLRATLPDSAIVVSAAKGIEEGSLKPMSTVLSEVLGGPQRVTVLSGPSFALEVIKGLPTAVTIAGRRKPAAESAAAIFHHGYFRVYTSTDIIGVEYGGVIKNVIALAVGVVDGFGMGHNARAALATRGLAEMQRLVVALGGEPLTVSGLSGLGDLWVTANGDLSRNRRVGLGLGQGKTLDQVLKEIGQVAEAVKITPLIVLLAKQLRVSVPIAEEVEQVLLGKHSPHDSLKALLGRAPRSEMVLFE